MTEEGITITKQATKGHLIVGGVRVFISLCCLIADLLFQLRTLPFLVFLFGNWGGVELGRYLEHMVSSKRGLL